MREGGKHLRPETGRLRTGLDPLAWPLRTLASSDGDQMESKPPIPGLEGEPTVGPLVHL